MEERFLKGFIAGVASAFVMNIWSFFAGLIQLSTLRMADWGAAILFGHAAPYSSGEIFFGLIAQIAFSGFLGIGFAYLIPAISSVWLVTKAIIYSNGVWFAANAIATLFQTPGLVGHPPRTILGNLIAATIFGYTLAKAWNVMAQASTRSTSQSGMIAAPAMKPDNKSEQAQNEDNTEVMEASTVVQSETTESQQQDTQDRKS